MFLFLDRNVDLFVGDKKGTGNKDCSALVVMSSAKIQVAMMSMQTAQMNSDHALMMEAQKALLDIDGLFVKALSLEPSSVEALFRYAHFKSMLGDFATALDLGKTALSFARSKEEMEEILKLVISTSAQLQAIAFLQKEHAKLQSPTKSK